MIASPDPPALIGELRQLIQQWRDEARQMREDRSAQFTELQYAELEESAGTCEACADELEALLPVLCDVSQERQVTKEKDVGTRVDSQ